MAIKFPQTFDQTTTLRFHLSFLAALVPVVMLSAILQGWIVLALVGVSAASAWASDEALRRIRRDTQPRDLASLLWGLYLALLLPATAPLLLAVVGPVFAVFVVKGIFGGGGTPWISPVLAAWAFLQAGWPKVFSSSGSALSSPHSPFDQQAVDWINTNVFSWLSIQLPGGYVDLFLGLGHPGTALIVESGCFFLLAGTVFLLAKGYFPWEIPATFFLSFSLPLVFAGKDVLLQIFSGSFLLNLFFLASDPSSRPLDRTALLLYGTSAGLLAFLVRTWGLAADGIGYAVLAMNLVVPWLDQRFRRKELNDFRAA